MTSLMLNFPRFSLSVPAAMFSKSIKIQRFSSFIKFGSMWGGNCVCPLTKHLE